MQTTPEPNKTAHKESLTNFDCYYLYGLTNNPYRQSNDFKSFEALYKKVIGLQGGILIGSSFHPYQLVNHKGTSVWHAAYIQVYLNNKKEEIFNAIINEKANFLVDPSAAFKDILVWPDTRLSYKENPVFSKYVPFVIPFLVYKTTEQPNWEHEINLAMATLGNASEYVEQITNLSRFILPEPSFVLGFDKLEETNPEQLIENFINCKGMLGE